MESNTEYSDCIPLAIKKNEVIKPKAPIDIKWKTYSKYQIFI